MRIPFLAAFLFASLLTASGQQTPESEFYKVYLESLPPLQRDVLQAIDRIAAERGVPAEEVRRAFTSVLLDGQCISKAGVGIVRDPVYVVVNSEVNQAIAGEVRPVGVGKKTPELFVFSRDNLVERVRIPTGGSEDLVFALFTPEQIRFFDWQKLSGGYYIRRSPGKMEPNKTIEPTAGTAQSERAH